MKSTHILISVIFSALPVSTYSKVISEEIPIQSSESIKILAKEGDIYVEGYTLR